MRRAQPLLLLFVLLSVVYHSNLRPVASGDSLPAALIPFAICLDGTVHLDRFGPWIDEHISYGPTVVRKSGGHWYSIYPIAGPVLVSPLYLPLALMPSVREQAPGTLIAIARVAEKLTAVLLAAASAVALFGLLRRLTTRRACWILTIVFALGTVNWSTSSQALWQHTFSALPIIGCLYAVDLWDGARPRWDWIAGVCAGLALAIRPTNVAMLPALMLALWVIGARTLAWFRVFVPAAAAAALTVAYNLHAFQSVTGGYPARLGGDWIEGLAGILVSPGRGLLLYTPVTLFALCAFSARARESRMRHRPLIAASAVFVLADVALVAKWPVWWGGYCWGPRLLTEVCAPIMVLIAAGWASLGSPVWRWSFAAAALYGCLIQAAGVYCYPKGRWDAAPVSVNEAPARLWDWADNPIGRTVQGGVVWEPYAIVTAGMKGGPPAAAAKLKELGINAY